MPGSGPQFLNDRDELLRRVCDYATREAERRRCQPWSIIGAIMGHGSGVSSCIYELYRRQDTGECSQQSLPPVVSREQAAEIVSKVTHLTSRGLQSVSIHDAEKILGGRLGMLLDDPFKMSRKDSGCPLSVATSISIRSSRESLMTTRPTI